jgi:predicted flap endonuclease-1-like 5' DNA nuclease
MQQPIEGGITFKPGRGIPGVEQEHFETPFEVLKAIQSAYPQTPGSWRRRGEILVASADDAHSPHENTDALWNIDADVGEFTWDNGPDVGEEPDVERAAPTDGIRDLKGVGEGRATALEAAGFLTPAHIRQATTDDLTTADTVGRNTARELMAQVEGVRFNTEGDTQAEAEA